MTLHPPQARPGVARLDSLKETVPKRKNFPTYRLEDLRGRYQQHQKLGVGATNVVHRVSLDGREYAGKQIIALSSRDFMEMYDLNSAASIRAICGEDGLIGRVMREMEVHYPLQHPNIAKMEGVILHDLFGCSVPFIILQELSEGGALDALVKKEGQLDELTVARFASHIFNGLQYLHQNNIIHRDLKMDNCLLNADATTLKICDFGEARHRTNQSLTQGVGAVNHHAPEIGRSGIYGEKVDVYAAGIIITEMFGFEASVGYENHRRQCQSVGNLTCGRFQGILDGTVCENPANRLSASQAWSLMTSMTSHMVLERP